jgi:hypothetical protein
MPTAALASIQVRRDDRTGSSETRSDASEWLSPVLGKLDESAASVHEPRLRRPTYRRTAAGRSLEKSQHLEHHKVAVYDVDAMPVTQRSA